MTETEKDPANSLYEILFDKLESLQKSLGLPPNFAATLSDDDDWSFVVKLNALFEAALTELICVRLGHNEIREPISRLDIGDTRRGKVIFASKLGLLDGDQNRFIQWLYELRNYLAHDIKTTVGFNLKKYVDNLCPKDKKHYANALKGVSPPDSAFSKPKDAVFVMAVVHLALIEIDISISLKRTEEVEVLRSMVAALNEEDLEITKKYH